MVHVKIKEIKSRMHIFLQSADVEEMLQQFQQSLPPLQPDARAAAFFHVPPLSDQQALRFLRLCQAHQIGILGINPGTHDPSRMRIVEQHVHSGERLSLQEETMLFGSVRPGGTLAMHSHAVRDGKRGRSGRPVSRRRRALCRRAEGRAHPHR